MFIAGIDGGGTHTRIEVRDMDNQLVRRGEFGPFNINSIGEEAFRALLREVFAWCGGMKDCVRLCVGAAGISNPKVGEILREELVLAGFAGKWKLCGDQEIALRGAMDGPGAVIISGTGSICFGKNAAGQTARSGGFGHLIDDGGSGYALGRDVLACAVRAVDGRLEDTAILQAVCQKLGSGPEGIVPFVYRLPLLNFPILPWNWRSGGMGFLWRSSGGERRSWHPLSGRSRSGWDCPAAGSPCWAVC